MRSGRNVKALREIAMGCNYVFLRVTKKKGPYEWHSYQFGVFILPFIFACSQNAQKVHVRRKADIKNHLLSVAPHWVPTD